jgi:GGDEF domain-containing protein
MPDDDVNGVADSLRVISGFTHSKGARLVFLNQNWRTRQTVFAWPTPKEDAAEGCQDKPDFWIQSRWWIDQLRQKRFLNFQDVRQIPDEAKADLCWLSEGVLKGLCLLAIYDGKRLAAILQLDNPSQDHPLRANDLHLISTASATIVQMMFNPAQAGSVFGSGGPEVPAIQGLSSVASNRVFFEDLLVEVIRRKGRLFAVLMVELENFSSNMQDYPEEVCKLVMKAAIERIRSCLRVSDVVLELDSNQIGVLLVDVFEPEGASTIAERIQDVFKASFRLPDGMLRLNGLVGLAQPETGDYLPVELMAAAAAALERAKAITQQSS